MSDLSRFVIIIKVIGIMSIGMSGAVYCPVSPEDPQQRLQSLTEQMQSRIALVHCLTGAKFNHDIAMVNIDVTIDVEPLMDDLNCDLLSNLAVTSNSIAYVIFTSGSTGTPKGVGYSWKLLVSLLADCPSISGSNSTAKLYECHSIASSSRYILHS